MDDQKTPAIYEPDKSLKEKVGSTVNLIPEERIKAAEKVVERSAGDILKQIGDEIEKIYAIKSRVKNPESFSNDIYDDIIKSAFSIKSSASICGYPILTSIAKSLYLFCESKKDKVIDEKAMDIILWHITSMKIVLDRRAKGNAGKFYGELSDLLEEIKTKFITDK